MRYQIVDAASGKSCQHPPTPGCPERGTSPGNTATDARPADLLTPTREGTHLDRPSGRTPASPGGG